MPLLTEHQNYLSKYCAAPVTTQQRHAITYLTPYTPGNMKDISRMLLPQGRGNACIYIAEVKEEKCPPFFSQRGVVPGFENTADLLRADCSCSSLGTSYKIVHSV